MRMSIANSDKKGFSEMTKYQATYRASGTMSDEYVEQMKADVKAIGSFSDFVNELYGKYRNGTLEGSAPAPIPSVAVDVEVPTNPAVETTEIIEAIKQSKQEIIDAIRNSVSAPVSPMPAPVPVPVAPTPVAAATDVDFSRLLTHDAMSVHKEDILREIVCSREKELARLDEVLEAIENLMPEPGDGNVMLTAEPKPVRTEQETPDTLQPVELMGEEEMSSFIDSLADEICDIEDDEDDDIAIADIADDFQADDEPADIGAYTVEDDEDEIDDISSEEEILTLTADDIDFETLLGLEELLD